MRKKELRVARYYYPVNMRKEAAVIHLAETIGLRHGFKAQWLNRRRPCRFSTAMSISLLNWP
jgi:hypothetical protein